MRAGVLIVADHGAEMRRPHGLRDTLPSTAPMWGREPLRLVDSQRPEKVHEPRLPMPRSARRIRDHARVQRLRLHREVNLGVDGHPTDDVKDTPGVARLGTRGGTQSVPA
jgi:hypothetical protein